jgi:preprotein translocase subunit SecY
MLANIANTFSNCFKIPELKSRIFFTLIVLAICRLAAVVRVPGLDGQALSDFFAANAQSGSLLGMYSMFTGGALEQCAIGALGIMPYISATIIIQLMTAVVPKLSKLAREEGGRTKIVQYGRYLTVLLCLGQGTLMTLGWEKPESIFNGFTGKLVLWDNIWVYRIITVIILTAGTMLLMWLGEQITERGIGNGISLIIFAGIAAGLPSAIGGTLELVRTGAMHFLVALGIFVAATVVTGFVVFVERGQRKILVNYAKRQVGRKVYGGQSSHLPLKLNMAGVIPPIFASSIILFPATLAGWFSSGESMSWLKDISGALSPGQPIYVMLYAAMIVFFCFFYTALVFNPKETAENLKKSGAFIPGIRPGDQTARYIERIMLRLTLAGAIYVTLVCLLPEFLILKWNVPFYFGGTSLLIIVVVTMDFMAQVQGYIMSHQYESLLKKTNFKGGGGLPAR